MTDMTAFAKKTTPGQRAHRAQWILDTVRANQEEAGLLLHALALASDAPTKTIESNQIEIAKFAIEDLYKSDRDALLQKNGILTDDQIEVLQS